MKKIIILISFVVLGAGLALGQSVTFTYDDAGNRVTRRAINLNTNKSKEDSTEFSKKELEEELAKQEELTPFDQLGKGQVKIYPNPTEGALMVRLMGLDSTEGIVLELYDQSGSKLQTRQLESELTEFNMYTYSPGTYILWIRKGSDAKSYKIIKN